MKKKDEKGRSLNEKEELIIKALLGEITEEEVMEAYPDVKFGHF